MFRFGKDYKDLAGSGDLMHAWKLSARESGCPVSDLMRTLIRYVLKILRE